jgi:hypothetical protein
VLEFERVDVLVLPLPLGLARHRGASGPAAHQGAGATMLSVRQCRPFDQSPRRAPAGFGRAMGTGGAGRECIARVRPTCTLRLRAE